MVSSDTGTSTAMLAQMGRCLRKLRFRAIEPFENEAENVDLRPKLQTLTTGLILHVCFDSCLREDKEEFEREEIWETDIVTLVGSKCSASHLKLTKKIDVWLSICLQTFSRPN